MTVPSTTISGSGFIDGITVVEFVEGDVTIAGNITVNDANTITVTNIQYPIALLGTTRTLRVRNGTAQDTHIITLNP